MEKEEQFPPTKKRLSLSVSKRKKDIEALEESVSKKPRFESSSASEIEMIMERSGHLSSSGVISYELTSLA